METQTDYTNPTGEKAQMIIAAHMALFDESMCMVCSYMADSIRSIFGLHKITTIECSYCGTQFTPYEGDELITCPRCEHVCLSN